MLPAPLLALSIVFHAVVSLSIFDLWFRSPVLEVKERYASGALAKRVVLIVGTLFLSWALLTGRRRAPGGQAIPALRLPSVRRLCAAATPGRAPRAGFLRVHDSGPLCPDPHRAGCELGG